MNYQERTKEELLHDLLDLQQKYESAVELHKVEIAENLQKEEKLRESLQFNQQVIDNAFTGIIVYDCDMRYQVWNPFMEKLTGIPASDVLGKRPMELFSFLKDTGVIDHLEKALSGITTESVDFQYSIPGTGKEGWTSEATSPLYNLKGKIIGAISTVSDINERKQAEEELRRNETFTRSALDNLPIIFYLVDQDGIFKLSTGSGLKGLGLKPNQVVGMSVYDIYKDFPVITDSIKKSLNGENVHFVSTVGGSSYDNFLVPVSNIKGILAGIAGIAIDITGHKMAENELKFSNELLSLYIKNSPIYTFIKEVNQDESRVLMASENYQEMTGIPGSEMKGKNMYEMFPKEFAEKMTADDWDVVSKGKLLILDEDFNDRNYTTIKFPISYGGKNILAGYTIDLTERKHAEEKLKESEQRYRTIFENALVGIYRTTPDGKILLVNPALVKMLGYDSAEELLQQNLEETGFVTPYSRRDFTSIIEREGKLEEFESAWIKKDGATVFIKESAVAHYDADGKILFYEGIVEDITEHKLVEKSLQKLDLAIRQSREVIFITDKEGIITFINPEFTKTYGYSAEEVLGKVTPRILKSGLVSAEVHAFLWKKILSKESVIAEYINKRKDGSLIEIEGSVDPILDEKGEIIGFLGIHRDITERKRADETIKILGNAIEQGPSSIMITNTSGKIEFVNNKFTTLTQYSLQDVSGKNPRIFNPGHLPENEFEELWNTLRIGDTWKGEVQNRRKDGSMFWEDLTISALMNPDDTVSKYILVMNDITEKKQMVDDLVAAKEKAEESDRLKSAFLANMGHEIRTPMNIIMGFAEQLNDPDLTSEEKKEYLSIIEKSGRGLLNIFNDIVSISKVEAGQMSVSISETYINELIEQIYSSFRDEAEQKGIMIIYDNGLTGQKNFINTDREKVNSILTNLVKNAIKFTNNGFIEIGHNQKGSYLECYVKDTGLGIKREQQEIIFEPFRQGSESLRRNYEGVGLGLSISKAYVEMLGGRIWVESLEGTGSVFYFTLPYGFEADQKNILRPVTVASEYQEDSSFNNLKILIVEDNEYSAKLLGKIVKPISRGVLIAKTGIQAVEICRENPDINLVLMDIQMPEMNGIEATKQIRKFNSDVIIIAQTAFVYTHNRQEAIEAGCNDYISKPIDSALLRKLVKEFFEKPK